MKKHAIFLLCITGGIILCLLPYVQTSSEASTTIDTPAEPIGKEPVLITSAGQAAESQLVYNMAKELNLQSDYRPRALGDDLYEYESVVLVLGYSANGLKKTHRTLEQEQLRVQELLHETKQLGLPLIIVHLSPTRSAEQENIQLLEDSLRQADYFISLQPYTTSNDMRKMADANDVPAAFVRTFSALPTPFNSVFR